MRAHLKGKGIVGVLGLSYKPSTGVIEESQGLQLAKELLSAGFRVVVYDPAAMENAQAELKGDVIFARTAAECVLQADAFAITTSWPELASISPKNLKRADGSAS